MATGRYALAAAAAPRRCRRSSSPTVWLGSAPFFSQCARRSSFDAELDRIAQRVVDTELLDETAVARAAAVGGDDDGRREPSCCRRGSIGWLRPWLVIFLESESAKLAGAPRPVKGGHAGNRPGNCQPAPDCHSAAMRARRYRPRRCRARRRAGADRLAVAPAPAPRGRARSGAAPDHLLHGRDPRDARALRLHERSPGRRRALRRRSSAAARAKGPGAAGRRGRAVVPREQQRRRRRRRTSCGRPSSARRWRSIGPPFAAGLAETDVAADSTGSSRPGALAVNLAGRPERRWRVAGVPLAAEDRGRRPGRGARRRRSRARGSVWASRPRIPSRPRSARRRACAAAGAELVIALAPVDKPVARRLAREAAVDLVVLGRQVGKGQARAEHVGNAFLVAPADELQRVGPHRHRLARQGPARRRGRPGGDGAAPRGDRPGGRAPRRGARRRGRPRAAAIPRSSPRKRRERDALRRRAQDARRPLEAAGRAATSRTA